MSPSPMSIFPSGSHPGRGGISRYHPCRAGGLPDQGIDTLYSFSRPDGALLVVVFKVGVSREQAIVDLNNQLDSNRDWLPQGLGWVSHW